MYVTVQLDSPFPFPRSSFIRISKQLSSLSLNSIISFASWSDLKSLKFPMVKEEEANRKKNSIKRRLYMLCNLLNGHEKTVLSKISKNDSHYKTHFLFRKEFSSVNMILSLSFR